MFIYGLIKSVVAVLLVDTVVLIGILIVGITKVNLGCHYISKNHLKSGFGRFG